MKKIFRIALFAALAALLLLSLASCEALRDFNDDLNEDLKYADRTKRRA